MHSATDLNYQRGYEWWLMTEARKVSKYAAIIIAPHVPSCIDFTAESCNQALWTVVGIPRLGEWSAHYRHWEFFELKHFCTSITV